MQQDEPAVGDLVPVTLHQRAHGVGVGRQPGGRRDLLELDLRPGASGAQAADGMREDRGNGGRGRHISSVWREEGRWGGGAPTGPD